MLRMYFRIAWRNLLKHPRFSIISTMGLGIALASFILILLYVNKETGYDNWDPRLKSVYRIDISQKSSDDLTTGSPYMLGNRLSQTCPEVTAVTRVIESVGHQVISSGENTFYEDRIIKADSTFFSVFPYQFIYGSSGTAMINPKSIVLSEQSSQKLFGHANPLGNIIHIRNTSDTSDYTVTGVINKQASHINFDYCISYFNKAPGNWGRQFYTSYISLKKGVSLEQLTQKADHIYEEGYTAYNRNNYQSNATEISVKEKKNAWIYLEPVTSIHLNPKASYWRDDVNSHPVSDYAKGNATPVIVFSITAILALLLACINHINLAVVTITKRAKDIGIQKILGARKKELIAQSMTETFLQCLASLIIAWVIANIGLSYFNARLGLQLSLWQPQDISYMYKLGVQIIFILLLLTVVSGVYPAFILTFLKPIQTLKGDQLKIGKGRHLKNGLIVFQFTISVVFIISMLIVNRQLGYMRNNNPGFTGEQVLAIRPARYETIDKFHDLSYIKSAIGRIPGVEGVAATDSYPGEVFTGTQLATFGNDSARLNFIYTDPEYFKLLDMKIIEGRDFSAQFAMDTINAAVINETAAKLMGNEKPIGKTVNILLRNYRIIGVLKDNFANGYTDKIQPSIYAIGAQPGLLLYNNLLVKINTKHIGKTLSAMENLWKRTEPGFPLQYTWVSDDFKKLISKYERMNTLSTIFTGISLLIALMGIFAMISFTTAQRTKEIGVRKIFGAGIPGLVALLSMDFMKLVLAAIVVAFPVAWWLMNQWLNGFAYRINISWWIFLIAGGGTLILALLTISVQAIKAASVNPVKSLRTE